MLLAAGSRVSQTERIQTKAPYSIIHNNASLLLTEAPCEAEQAALRASPSSTL